MRQHFQIDVLALTGWSECPAPVTPCRDTRKILQDASRLTVSALKAQTCSTECCCNSLGVRRELEDRLNRSLPQFFTTEAAD